jgi:regulator of protease activity HflC (stomatin/prohibitin superfamily)
MIIEPLRGGTLGNFVGENTNKGQEKSVVYHFWKNSISTSVLKADLRQLPLEISGQKILTRDKAALRVNFSVQYKVTEL